MKTIWKYPLKLTDLQTVEMPQDAEILSVQFQGAQLCLWAVVFPEQANLTEQLRRIRQRTIIIYGTGHTMRTDCDDKFIGTVQQDGGSLVWHVFERIT